MTRFHHAVEVAIANPARTVRGDTRQVLPDVLASIPAGLPVCLIDTYVHVFFTADELIRFRAVVDQLGAERDLDWVSIDPLVPLGGRPIAACSVCLSRQWSSSATVAKGCSGSLDAWGTAAGGARARCSAWPIRERRGLSG